MELLPYTPKQQMALQLAQQGRINIWEGAVRSGKTINSLLAWAYFVGTAPQGPLLMVGRTSDTLRRNVMEPLVDILGTKYVRVSYGGGWAQIFGRKIYLIGADNQAAESRIRGLTLAGAYVDELTIIGANHGQEFFNMLLTRLSVKGAKVFATTNPGHPNHWLLKNYLDNAEIILDRTMNAYHNTAAPKGLGVYRYRFTIEDNESLPAEYIASLKASLTGVFYDRFILGEWVQAEGAVFPHFTVCEENLPPRMELENYVIGIDVGTTNATHAVLLATNYVRKTVHILGEYRTSDNTLTYNQQVELIYRWIRGLSLPVQPHVVVDPSARAFRNEWKRVVGIYPWAAHNAVLEGISDLGSLLSQGVLKIHKDTSPVLVGELQGYRWDSKASERGEDKPVKEEDHGVDALRYAIQAIKKTWKPWVTVDHSPPPKYEPPWKKHPQTRIF